MAGIAIDPTDIRQPGLPRAKTPRVARRTLVLAAGAIVGVAGIGAAGASLLSRISLPSELSGLAFLPKPDAPRRSEIRIGKLPDMPEIHDGVPQIVTTRPVWTAEASPSMAERPTPRPVAVATASPAVLTTAAPLPAGLTPAALTKPRDVAAFPMSPDLPIGLPAERPAIPSSPAPEPVAFTPKVPADVPVTVPVPVPVEAAEPVAPAEAPQIVRAPLPPPAPARNLVRSAEPRPDKPAKSGQPATRQAAAAASPAGTAPAGAAQPAAPEERVEILGLTIPTGRDVQNAVSSIGEALNLPKVF